MEKIVKVTVNLKHARKMLRFAGFFKLANEGTDEEVFAQVLDMMSCYGAKTEDFVSPKDMFGDIKEIEINSQNPVEIAVRRAAAEHANSEEITKYVDQYGEDALEEIILELIDEITAEREAKIIHNANNQEE